MRRRDTLLMVGAVLGLTALAACTVEPDVVEGVMPPSGLFVRPDDGVVRIEPLFGVPEADGRRLAYLAAESLRAGGRPALVRPAGNGRYVLLGGIDSEAGEGAATLRWVLVDRKTGQAVSHEGRLAEVPRVSEAAETAVVADIRRGLATLMARAPQEPDEGAPQAAEPNEGAPQAALADRGGILVGPGVATGPGDDPRPGQALQRAMALALEARGVPVVSNATAASATVEPVATVGEAGPDTRTVRIVWLVSDTGGRPVGRAQQENVVRADALTGDWGRLAAMAAAAAAPDVERLAAQVPAQVRAPAAGPDTDRHAAAESLLAAAPVPAAASRPADAPVPGAEPPAPSRHDDGGRPFLIQLGSVRSAPVAEREMGRLGRVHPDLFEAHPLTIEATDLGKRGVYHRIRAGGFAGADAARRGCADLRARGERCLVVRGEPPAGMLARRD